MYVQALQSQKFSNNKTHLLMEHIALDAYTGIYRFGRGQFEFSITVSNIMILVAHHY